MDEKEKYTIYQKAKETGGPCEICGWKDGDGTRTCFYGKEIGIVTHENSAEGVMSTMTESQRHLYQLRQALVYISPEFREKKIAFVAYEKQFYFKRHPEDAHKAEEWNTKYRESEEKEGLATDPKYQGWIQEPWWAPVESGGIITPSEFRGLEKTEPLPISGKPMTFTAYMVHVYESHSCGKGHRYQKAPYHYGCTGCGTEIKLWEHGVDHDMG